MRIGFIGAGRAGSALATALGEAGYPVVAVADRRSEKARLLAAAVGAIALPAPRVVEEAEVVFLSVPDDEIASSARNLAAEVGTPPEKIFFHLSGLHPARLLQPLAGEENGGSLHPLIPLAERVSGAERLRHCLYTFEGGEKAAAVAQRLVDRLGGVSGPSRRRKNPSITPRRSWLRTIWSPCSMSPSASSRGWGWSGRWPRRPSGSS